MIIGRPLSWVAFVFLQLLKLLRIESWFRKGLGFYNLMVFLINVTGQKDIAGYYGQHRCL